MLLNAYAVRAKKYWKHIISLQSSLIRSGGLKNETVSVKTDIFNLGCSCWIYEYLYASYVTFLKQKTLEN